MGEHTITKKKKKQQKKKKDKAKERVEVEEEMVREDEIEVNGDDQGLSKNEEEAQVNEGHDEYADDADEVAKIAEEEDNPLPSSPQPSPTIITSESRLPFTSFPLSSLTLRALSSLSLTDSTPIQSACLPPLLAGQDLLGAAPTGSGKTLAFLLPSIELLHRLKFKPANGTGVIVISPTRELALQIFGVARDLLREGGFSQTVGVLMGGANRRAEEEKLCKGVALVVATPGRLWDHLRDTKGFVRRNLKALIIDEADRILEIGFEQQMRDIIAMLPKERQTILFSATQTTKVTDLARISLRPGPLYIDVAKSLPSSTVPTLSQGYIVCPAEHRFLLLFTFLKKNLKKKVIVFFSSCISVKYHAELLNYIDVPVLDLHGKQKQQKRTTTFFSFLNSSSGTLLCTNVAARGLDIPSVDYIIQYDPPDDPRDYIHRVGRTARAGKGGKSLLFLMESELGFLRYLKEAKVTLNEFGFPKDRVENVQSQLERLLEKNYHLYQSAVEGFRAYLQAYASYGLKRIFDVNKLDLGKVGKAFGFKVPPRVNLGVPGGGSGKGEVDSESLVVSKGKRRREEVSDDEESEQEVRGYRGKEKEKRKRIEVLGRKAVEKEKYKKGKVGANWSR